MQATNNLIELRQLLAQRFPQVRMGTPVFPPVDLWETGVASLDTVLGGGLLRGEFTELIVPGKAAGSAQLVHAPDESNPHCRGKPQRGARLS